MRETSWRKELVLSEYDTIFDQIQDLLLEKLGYKIEGWEAGELAEEIVDLLQGNLDSLLRG